MKEVKSKTGETELQTPEYLPDGPVQLPTTAPDTRPMVNRADGTPAAKAPERPVYAPLTHPADAYMLDLAKRIEALESQIKSIQMSLPKGVTKAP